MENEQENKASLKFKIPKINSSAVDQEAGGSSRSPGNMNQAKRVCSECQKEFCTAKALAGHMRVHGQAAKNQQRLHDVISARKQPVLKNQGNQSGSDSQNSMQAYRPVSCDLCSKRFRTATSLFGHMRCHPERTWRGMRPPEVPKWRVKARRGRRSLKNQVAEVSHSYEDEDEDDEDEGMGLFSAVNNLMLLKHADCSGSSGLSTLAAAAENTSSDGDLHQEDVANGNSYREEFDEQVGKKRKGSVGMADDYHVVSGPGADHGIVGYTGFVQREGKAVQIHDVDEGSDGVNTELVLGEKHFDGIHCDKHNHRELAIGKGKTKIKKVKLMRELNQEKPLAVGGSGSAEAAAVIASEKFKCSTCDKCFSSPQALGGHRSSHNKFKVTVINGTDGVADKHRPHQKPSSVSASALPGPTLVKNEELNKSHPHQLLKGEECPSEGNNINEVGGSSQADRNRSIVYKCTMCCEKFPSLKALKGHKRCQWAAPADGLTEAEAEAPPLVQAEAQPQAQLAGRSSGGEAGTQAGSKRIRLMGIDLDVAATPVDDACPRS